MVDVKHMGANWRRNINVDILICFFKNNGAKNGVSRCKSDVKQWREWPDSG
jgi:hypothetical protein